MQPRNRDVQSMNSILNQHSQSQIADSGQHQHEIHDAQHSFDPTTVSHDDFLEQMLNSLPSTTWPPPSSDLSSDAGQNFKANFPWDSSHNNNTSSAFDEDSAMLASKLRQHQISCGRPAASAALMLQQQLFMSRGLAGGLHSPKTDSGAGESGLLPLPLSLSNGDDGIDVSSFKALNQGGGDGSSIQALFNGFTGSLHASSQTSNQVQHLKQSQGMGGGNMQSQNYGGVGGMSQALPGNGGGSGGTTAQPRPRVRARRGQATDPHSIAERLRRERIAERMKSLQELVPNANKTDKASMLDEIIDYVKFLQLQVKVLSMSRLGGARAVAPPTVGDISSEGGDCRQANGSGGISRNGNGTQTAASSSSNNNNDTMIAASSSSNNNNDAMTVTEHQVAKLMEEDMCSAMQYLQGKGLCLMPISLATAISTVTATTRSHHPLLPSNGVGGPTSPSLSVSVQSATRGGGGINNDTSVKDSTSVSKPS